jgi:acyl-CoA thioesterase-1
VLFLGTSLTAGYGLDDPAHDAYPMVIQHIADSLQRPIQVVSAGLSGETSAGALRRTDWLLRGSSDVVVIETGANDGLRGLRPDSTAANLRAIIAKVRVAQPKAEILLVQMEAPTNLGQGYTRDFHAIFAQVAKADGVTLTPFLLEGVAGVPKLNQGDGIHPTPEGARLAARNLWPSIARALERRPAR